MLFKDLKVGDVFKLTNGDTTFIKLNTVNDDEYPFKRYYNYPSNVFIIDKLHYGVISPMAVVYRTKEYHGQEQEKTPLKELLEKYESDIHRQNFMTYGGVPYDIISKDVVHYAEADVRNTMAFLEMCRESQRVSFPSVEKVIFNKPATIVIWKDGTKTVVKCQNDEKFDPEKGLALCYMKKACGNKSNFNNTFKEWIKPETIAVYDESHPELGIQDLPPKNKSKLPSNVIRITLADKKFIHKYMRDNGITYQHISNVSGLHIDTVKRALTGCPILINTVMKIIEYFDFPINTTRYAED